MQSIFLDFFHFEKPSKTLFSIYVGSKHTQLLSYIPYIGGTKGEGEMMESGFISMASRFM